MTMDGGIPTVNNPSRVPPLLELIDGPQEGAPRLIHPVGMLVGTPVTGAATMAETEHFIVPNDGVYLDDSGSPIQLFKGDALPRSRAAQFTAFRAKVGDEPVFTPAVDDVDDEHGDTEPPGNGENLVTNERAKGKAPANRSRGAAPENRSE
jgi:hypothetical protein